MKPNFVGQVRIDTTETSLSVEWDLPFWREAPEEYVVVLRNTRGKVVNNTRRMVPADKELKVSYTDLDDSATYRVAIRGKTEKQKGRWVVTTVTLGTNPPALPDSHYMYQVAAGEETPEDAIGKPTRHVRLEKGVWTPFNPGREYKTSAMWWWYDELDQAEETIDMRKEELDKWIEQNPDTPTDQTILSILYDVALAEKKTILERIVEEERKVDAEISRRYPPENYTVDDVRWVQRPKRYAR